MRAQRKKRRTEVLLKINQMPQWKLKKINFQSFSVFILCEMNIENDLNMATKNMCYMIFINNFIK